MSGKLYGVYNLKNQWNIGYKYYFNLNKLKYGFDISIYSEENTIVLLSMYLSTFQKDLTIYFSYRQGLKYDLVYPFTVGISKLYQNINLELNFTPSDITGNCFNCKISYYFDKND